jgi:hypothetical protein
MIHGAILASLAIIGAITVAHWLRAQHRAYSGVNRSIQYYLRPK